MELKDLLAEFVNRKASDLHLMAQQPPTLRIDGDLIPLDTPPLEPQAAEQLFAPYVSEAELFALRDGQDVNTSIEWAGKRFRCCIFRDRTGTSAALRLIPCVVPSLRDLFGERAETFRKLTQARRGLILLAGNIGSGKSTTVAAMLNEINGERSERIITIEDPIEYIHSSQKSLFSQREVGKDVESLEHGALSALRADLDVALIGELRTPEAVRIALTLAETGHLVFSTLMADTASEAIQRLVEAFPEGGDRIRRLLARTVLAVIAQRLLPRASLHGRVPVNEILLATPRVRRLIDEGTTDFTLALEAGRGQGMCTMDDAVLTAYRADEISYDTAWNAIGDRERLGEGPHPAR